eukprot:5876306-Karenia_brevis.AAC.1
MLRTDCSATQEPDNPPTNNSLVHPAMKSSRKKKALARGINYGGDQEALDHGNSKAENFGMV